jgi:isopentenyldiphosphate isomerase
MRELERFDIYDEHGSHIGTATREDVHRDGLWHQTFHCWIYAADEDGPYVLFQLRHAEKDTFPGLLDVSSAGHLLAGETPEDGVRELEEELGVTVSAAELLFCGVYVEEDWLPNGMIDRERCHVFALQRSLPLASYRLQPDEVSGLFRLRLGDLPRLLAGERIEISGVLLQQDGTLQANARTVDATDFVPHSPDYYAVLLAALAVRGVSV